MTRRVLLACMLVLWGPLAGWAEAQQTLRIVYEEAPNPPRHLGDGSEVPEPPGITVDMLRLAAERLGLELELLRVPWVRGLFMIETGQADAIFHASFKADRLSIGVYPIAGDSPDESRAIFYQKYVFYVRQDSGVTWDGSVLDGATRPAGATSGYSVIDDLAALGIPVESERNQLINFCKLQEGRIDAYAELQTMADPYLAADGGMFEGIVRLDPAIVEKAYYLMFSHQFHDAYPALAESVWDEIRRINNSQDIDRIVARYSGAD